MALVVACKAQHEVRGAGLRIGLQPFSQAFGRAGVACLARAQRCGGLAVVSFKISVEALVGAAGIRIN